MSLSKQYKTNVEKEIGGVKVELDVNVTADPATNGTIPTMYLARMSEANTKYSKILEKETKPFTRQIQANSLSKAKSNEIFSRVFARGIVLGWENILLSDVNGNDEATGFAEFTEANVIALLLRLPDLYTELQTMAKEATLFKDEEREIAAKN